MDELNILFEIRSALIKSAATDNALKFIEGLIYQKSAEVVDSYPSKNQSPVLKKLRECVAILNQLDTPDRIIYSASFNLMSGDVQIFDNNCNTRRLKIIA